MAIDLAPATPLGLNGQVLGDRWIEQFLTSGCLLASPSGRVRVGWGEALLSESAMYDRLSVYAPDFLLEDAQPWIGFAESAELDSEDLRLALLRYAQGFPEFEPLPDWNNSTFREFAEVFHQIQFKIEDGSLSKAVPAVSRVSPQGLSGARIAWVLACALRTSSGFPIMPFGFWLDNGEGMIGVTPELLFCQEGEHDVRTMALAGTRRVAEPGGSLLEDGKEMYEHSVVVDGIVERLSMLGSVEVGETSEMRLPALIHLHTPISVHPSADTEFEGWVRALHPTPAIGAWPREAGWRWLCEQKSARTRRRFGAPFGVVPPDSHRGRCVVAIRNVQWTQSETLLMAGCGIVAASKLEREWAELNAKLDSIQGALGL